MLVQLELLAMYMQLFHQMLLHQCLSMFIQTTAVDGITIAYDTLDYYNKNRQFRLSASSFTYKLDLEKKGRRAVHSVLLYELDPETEYFYQVTYNAVIQYTAVYKTLGTNTTQSSMTVAIGGDIGSSDLSAELTTKLVSSAPDVFIVGGNAAGDHGLQSCWYCWDLFLNGFEKYNSLVNRTIPIILSAGNQDVGFNSLSGTGLNTEELPLYFILFPQHLGFNETSQQDAMMVPDPSTRRTNFYHLVGNTMQWSLDSGFVATYEDQAAWMKNVLPDYTDYVKFGSYHMPIYPACSDPLDMPAAHIQVAYNNFVPIFEAFGFKALFENHVHMFKKTFPLKQGAVDSEGVVYLGDGNWGPDTNTCLKNGGLVNSTGVQEAVSNIRHVWILNMNSTNYEIYPVDSTGTQFYDSISGEITTGSVANNGVSTATDQTAIVNQNGSS